MSMPDKIKPNLFFVGAPKCGTTAISNYLSNHPDVYFSKIKEPNYFSFDYSKEWRRITDLKHYIKLFEKGLECKVRAEGSTSYLYSDVAILEALKFSPGAKFVAFVRNPLYHCMAYHRDMSNSRNEDVYSFSEAWSVQGEREIGKKIPVKCLDDKLVLYRKHANFGYYISKFYDLVPEERRHLIVYEDFVADPSLVYKKLLNFIGIEFDGREDFAVFNPASVTRSKLVKSFLLYDSKILKSISLLMKKINGGMPLGVYRYIDGINRRPSPIPYPGIDIQNRIIEYYRDDISLLEKTINRDLSEWLIPKVG